MHPVVLIAGLVVIWIFAAIGMVVDAVIDERRFRKAIRVYPTVSARSASVARVPDDNVG